MTIQRGNVVRVGLAYRMELGPTPDEATGFVGTVVDVRPSGDALLARGVYAETPDPSEWDLAVNVGRCEVLS